MVGCCTFASWLFSGVKNKKHKEYFHLIYITTKKWWQLQIDVIISVFLLCNHLCLQEKFQENGYPSYIVKMITCRALLSLLGTVVFTMAITTVTHWRPLFAALSSIMLLTWKMWVQVNSGDRVSFYSKSFTLYIYTIWWANSTSTHIP